ncbi:MAG: methyl-accepting chemotaxis protein [Firmicutes bacterium]|nr:methyl-accepting chemotaxis protein [Bacillota bacterium]
MRLMPIKSLKTKVFLFTLLLVILIGSLLSWTFYNFHVVETKTANLGALSVAAQGAISMNRFLYRENAAADQLVYAKDQSAISEFKQAAEGYKSAKRQVLDNAQGYIDKNLLRQLGTIDAEVSRDFPDRLTQTGSETDLTQFRTLTREQLDIAVRIEKDLSSQYLQSERDIVSYTYISQTLVTVAGLGLVLLLSIAGFIWSGVLTKSLINMVRTLARVSKGELNLQVDVVNFDEVGQIEAAIGKMVGDLRGIVVSIDEGAQLVNTSAQQLTANTAQIVAAINMVAQSVQNINYQAQTQIERTREASTAVGQLSSAIQHSNANIQNVAENSGNTFSLAKQGSVEIGEVIQKMESINLRAKDSAEVIKQLGETGKEVGKIVDFITEVASQTNLLALNAAIEAARAGEQGRGFAVVAEEVRKLAEQSADSAKEISTLINDMQNTTLKAVSSIQVGNREVTEGLAVTRKAGEALKQILLAVEKVNARIQEITAANQQMAAASEFITPIMEHVAEGATMIGDATIEVNSAIQEESASMTGITVNVEQLAKFAVELQYIVQKFKLH